MADRTRTEPPDAPAPPLPVEETLHVCGGCGAAELGKFPDCARGLAPHAETPHPDAPEETYPLAHWVAHNLGHHTEINRAHAERHKHLLEEGA